MRGRLSPGRGHARRRQRGEEEAEEGAALTGSRCCIPPAAGGRGRDAASPPPVKGSGDPASPCAAMGRAPLPARPAPLIHAGKRLRVRGAGRQLPALPLPLPLPFLGHCCGLVGGREQL